MPTEPVAPLMPLSPLKARCGGWGTLPNEARAKVPILGTPAAWALQKAKAMEGVGLAPQRRPVAARRKAAGWLPLPTFFLPD